MREDNLEKDIGEKLKAIRLQRGLSQSQVGNKLDFNYTYLSKIENGQIPSLKLLKKLADFYNISVAELFGEEVSVPNELKEIGVDYISIAKELKEKEISPEQMHEIMKMVEMIKKGK